ncbi:MAG: hypothetical protein H7062_12925, partial [Candidatus Saccharimonas sp.]|nr:hypothetical protein [Planctomycetaceae bacterium]
MTPQHSRPLVAATLALCAALSASSARAQLSVSPTAIHLDRPEGSQQLLVTVQEGELRRDVTREVKYEVRSPAVIVIGADGLIQPLAEGNSQLVVRHGAVELQVAVTVSGLQQPVPVSFVHEVQPILTKARCNSGGCHGKAEGQNGFKLSLLGFDESFDHDSIVKEGKGRRVVLTAPERSILLRKATAAVPHGGGQKIEQGSPQYRRLLRWISAGAPSTVPDERQVI